MVVDSKISIFWCGSIPNDAGLRQYAGEDPAAANWSYGLLKALIDHDCAVMGFAPQWDSLFPKGHLLPGNPRFLEENIPQTPIPYINFPRLRTWSVSRSLVKQITMRIKSHGLPTAILSYNTYPHFTIALRRLSKVFPGIIFINVILDLDDPTADSWRAYKNSTHFSDASLFVSWWGFQNAPISSKLHLDGGWNGAYPSIPPCHNFTFVYAGKYDDHGGIKTLISAIKKVTNKDVRFHFYGKGAHPDLSFLARHDTRISLKGFVSEDELFRACQHAMCFLSPRSLEYQGTKMIFPSKLLFYLRFRKPVISSLLPGMSPEYSSIVFQPNGDTVDDWVSAMNKVLSTSESDLHMLAIRITEFLNKKTWSIQAARLIRFIQNLNPLDKK